jgi:hypothetical protein
MDDPAVVSRLMHSEGGLFFENGDFGVFPGLQKPHGHGQPDDSSTHHDTIE